MYNAPFEDTDTLVLTSTKSGFVDLRFPRKRELGRPVTADPSFWGFSGSSSTTFLQGDGIGMPYSAHCVWKHEIDSKGPGISDEGDMFVLPNGDCMEVGMMQNPKTGKVEMYKEYWTSPATTTKPHLTPCIVAKTNDRANDDDERTASIQIGSGGTIIRIGNYCQGIMRQPAIDHAGDSAKTTAVLVERWTRGLAKLDSGHGAAREDSNTSNSESWDQDWRSNTPSDSGVSMPCMWVCDNDRKPSDETVVQGITWKVVEVVTGNPEGQNT